MSQKMKLIALFTLAIGPIFAQVLAQTVPLAPAASPMAAASQQPGAAPAASQQPGAAPSASQQPGAAPAAPQQAVPGQAAAAPGVPAVTGVPGMAGQAMAPDGTAVNPAQQVPNATAPTENATKITTNLPEGVEKDNPCMGTDIIKCFAMIADQMNKTEQLLLSANKSMGSGGSTAANPVGVEVSNSSSGVNGTKSGQPAQAGGFPATPGLTPTSPAAQTAGVPIAGVPQAGVPQAGSAMPAQPVPAQAAPVQAAPTQGLIPSDQGISRAVEGAPVAAQVQADLMAQLMAQEARNPLIRKKRYASLRDLSMFSRKHHNENFKIPPHINHKEDTSGFKSFMSQNQHQMPVESERVQLSPAEVGKSMGFENVQSSLEETMSNAASSEAEFQRKDDMPHSDAILSAQSEALAAPGVPTPSSAQNQILSTGQKQTLAEAPATVGSLSEKIASVSGGQPMAERVTSEIGEAPTAIQSEVLDQKSALNGVSPIQGVAPASAGLTAANLPPRGNILTNKEQKPFVTSDAVTGRQGEVSTDEGTLPVADRVEVEPTTAKGEATTAEGEATTVKGEATRAEGEATTAKGEATTVKGEATTAEGDVTTAEGEATSAAVAAARVEGKATPFKRETTTAKAKAARVEAARVEGAQFEDMSKEAAMVEARVEAARVEGAQFEDMSKEAAMVEAEPVKAEPVKAEPVKAELAKVEPITIEPFDVEPIEVKPFKAEQVNPEPVNPEPINPELIKAEPVKAEPVRAEPVKAKPVNPESVNPEPVKAEPVKAEPVKAEPVKAGPVKAEPVKAEPVEAVLVKSELVEAVPAEAMPVKEAPVKALPVETASAEVEAAPVKGEAISPERVVVQTDRKEVTAERVAAEDCATTAEEDNEASAKEDRATAEGVMRGGSFKNIPRFDYRNIWKYGGLPNIVGLQKDLQIYQVREKRHALGVTGAPDKKPAAAGTTMPNDIGNNEMANRATGVANGNANGVANGVANGGDKKVVNGGSNGMANRATGVANGNANGHANGVANGGDKKVVNGGSNGMTNGTANGTANGVAGDFNGGSVREKRQAWGAAGTAGNQPAAPGIAMPNDMGNNGMANGMANGAANGVANGAANGVPNGAANGVANGAANGVANGAANGVANGAANGMTNGMANGVAGDSNGAAMAGGAMPNRTDSNGASMIGTDSNGALMVDSQMNATNPLTTTIANATTGDLGNMQQEIQELETSPNGLVLVVKAPGDSNLEIGQEVDGNLNPIISTDNFTMNSASLTPNILNSSQGMEAAGTNGTLDNPTNGVQGTSGTMNNPVNLGTMDSTSGLPANGMPGANNAAAPSAGINPESSVVASNNGVPNQQQTGFGIPQQSGVAVNSA